MARGIGVKFSRFEFAASLQLTLTLFQICSTRRVVVAPVLVLIPVCIIATIGTRNNGLHNERGSLKNFEVRQKMLSQGLICLIPSSLRC